jgi:hypothetical protein
LLEEEVLDPITPLLLTTLPPLEIFIELLAPPKPIMRSLLLLQTDPLPVTRTELLEEEVLDPITPLLLTTLPPLEIFIKLLAPPTPIMRDELFVSWVPALRILRLLLEAPLA